jgi:hypothetical protein
VNARERFEGPGVVAYSCRAGASDRPRRTIEEIGRATASLRKRTLPITAFLVRGGVEHVRLSDGTVHTIKALCGNSAHTLNTIDAARKRLGTARRVSAAPAARSAVKPAALSKRLTSLAASVAAEQGRPVASSPAARRVAELEEMLRR